MAEKSTDRLKKSKMSLVGVIALIFSFVAAGAFGIEEAIVASGPGATMIMLIIFPFIWAFPLCEMVGEMGSLYPTEGGLYSWGRETFGEFWGWQVGLWAGLSTWLSQAQYCVLVAGYVGKMMDLDTAGEWIVKISMVAIFTIINIVGLNFLEKLETVFTILVLLAFGVVTVVGFMNWNYNPMVPMFNQEAGLFHSFGDGIAIIIWMYCGYECMSNMAEELENPQVIPRAMRWSQPVVALSYVLPTLAGLAAIGSWSAWSSEYAEGTVGYADVLIQYVGNWAGVLFLIIAIISNCSIFCSYIAQGARCFFVMADDHMFPPFIKKVDKRGQPTVAILALAVVIIICCQFDFTTLVMATTPLQLFIYLMLLACVIKIRKRYPVADRIKSGFTVMPGGVPVLVGLGTIVFLICMFALYSNGLDYFLVGFILLAAGLVAYPLCKWRYKGRVLDDPKAFPLNPKTKLGYGDLGDISVYVILSGAVALLGAVFLRFYEADYGVEYYLEEYETGLLSNFYGMLSLLTIIGLVCMVVGAILWVIAKKTEGEKLRELHHLREEELDNRLREIHGFLPGEVPPAAQLVEENVENVEK